jgi:formate dehydrogenase maturation protein FdhE
MQQIPQHTLDFVFFSDLCPVCRKSSTKDYLEVIKPTKTLNYARCKLCSSAFRLTRKKMKHPDDQYYHGIWYIKDEVRYAVKGYYISNETFIKNRNKFHIKKYYSNFFISKDEFSVIA